MDFMSIRPPSTKVCAFLPDSMIGGCVVVNVYLMVMFAGEKGGTIGEDLFFPGRSASFAYVRRRHGRDQASLPG